MGRKKCIAIMTGGGDCAGLNAVIRAITKKAILEHDWEVLGIRNGFEGLIHNHVYPLDFDKVSNILTLGGTILGTSNKANPYRYIAPGESAPQDRSKEAIANFRSNQIDVLVCIGGDGTLTIANQLFKDGIPMIGVPKTIDNDILGTEITFGFNSAVEIATEGIDRLHSTAQSHQRVMIVEVMGRKAGWIALYAGVAGGADIILIPEIPHKIEEVVVTIQGRQRSGRRCSIVVIAEGAKPQGGDVTIQRMVKDSVEPVRLGGIGFVLGDQIEKLTGQETRTVVMGHLQRGGTPTAYDRTLATELGTRVVEMIEHHKCGFMIGIKSGQVIDVPLEEVAKGTRLVPVKHPLIQSARSVGTAFGDAVRKERRKP